jgi:hypothetical protein
MMHALNLSTVRSIAPTMAVPGSAGFRFAGPGMDWCNAFLFPMSRERFLADLAVVAPQIETRTADPGDVFEIERGAVTHHAQASSIARMLEDDTARLRLDPTAEVPALRDPNPAGVSTAHLVRAVDEALDAFVAFLRASYVSGEPVVDEYRACGASYAVGVVFPDGPERWLHVTLGEGEPRFTRSERAAAPADAGHRIVASALTAWTAREKSYFYLRAFSRKWSTLYALAMKDGKVVVEPREPRDLLAYYLERKAKGADQAVKHWLDLQLKPYLPARG